MATSNSRLMARISIISLIIFIISLFLYAFLELRYGVLYIMIVISFFTSSVINFFVLRCQACGNRGGRPQWYKNKTIHCPKCGTAYEYDR